MKSRKLLEWELCGDGPGSNDHKMQSSFRCLESYSEQPSVKTGSKLGRGGASDYDLKLGKAWVRAKYKCVAKKVIIIIIDHLRMQPDGYGAVIYIF